MNEFINNVYGAIGSEVSGYYNGVPFLGTITDTRPRYGNDIQVRVVDDEGRWFIINGTELLNGSSASYSNLHVYFE
jgi:hypothetical protein